MVSGPAPLGTVRDTLMSSIMRRWNGRSAVSADAIDQIAQLRVNRLRDDRGALAVGWTPSAWFSAGLPATPSSRNGTNEIRP